MADESEFMRTVEINGVKLEVDMRTARKVESYRVGDRVKVLKKEYSSYKVHPGVIVAFDPFVALPTITVAYIDITYSKASIEFVFINAETEGIEMAPYEGDLLVDREEVISRIDKEIEGKEREITELTRKKDYFASHFAAYFGDVADLAARVDG